MTGGVWQIRERAVMWILLVIILLPLVEIALFIILGSAIGLFPTLAIVIGSAILGGAMIKREQAVVQRTKEGSMSAEGRSLRPVAMAAMGIAAGFLLIAPGFLTDAMGLILLIPAVRAMILVRFAQGGSEFAIYVAGVSRRGNQRGGHGDVIEGEIVEAPSDPRPGNMPDGPPQRLPADRPRGLRRDT
jgi:UPF0716 protein FxsA